VKSNRMDVRLNIDIGEMFSQMLIIKSFLVKFTHKWK